MNSAPICARAAPPGWPQNGAIQSGAARGQLYARMRPVAHPFENLKSGIRDLKYLELSAPDADGDATSSGETLGDRLQILEEFREFCKSVVCAAPILSFSMKVRVNFFLKFFFPFFVFFPFSVLFFVFSLMFQKTSAGERLEGIEGRGRGGRGLEMAANSSLEPKGLRRDFLRRISFEKSNSKQI